MGRTLVALTALTCAALFSTSCTTGQSGPGAGPASVPDPPSAPTVTTTQKGFAYELQLVEVSRVPAKGSAIARPGRNYVSVTIRARNLQQDRSAPAPRAATYVAVPSARADLYVTNGWIKAKRCRVAGNGDFDLRTADSTRSISTSKPLTSGLPVGSCTHTIDRLNGPARAPIPPGSDAVFTYFTEGAFDESFDPEDFAIYAPQDDPNTVYGGYVQVPGFRQ
ncbi:hypothetical protein [Pseudonocardia sp. NPDC049635]|uniref:hypothetical protein n=1 Tax=Pseudonocardia sp. NPDC049635 TaxID=3155506 RepID=UPI0033D82B5B